MIPDLPLDQEERRRAIEIFDSLRVPDVPGNPPFKAAAGDWFREIVGALHGSLDVRTHQRRIREALLLVPKKNSKTTGGAALMLTSLLLNMRPRAEFLLVAPTQPITDLAYSQIVGMIALDPDLAARMHVQTHLKRITYLKTGATLQVKSFDARIMTGVRPAGVLLDELHVVSESSEASRVIGQIRGGLVSQPEGFLVFITTQSERPPAGAFMAELSKARAIRDGRVDGKMLPVLYEFPAEYVAATRPGTLARWADPKLWAMVNPNVGRSITVERLEEDFATARATGAEEIARWASQHLNIEIGLALRSDRWAGADWWEQAADPALTLDELLVRSDVAVVGIDGGGLDDLLGLAVVGRDAHTREWLHWGRAWAHRVALDRRKSEAERMRDFEGDGDLVIFDDLGEDIEGVCDVVDQVEASGLLPVKHGIGLDPVGIGQIVDEMASRGIGGERIVGIPQGWKLSGAIKTTERKLADGTFRHGGARLLAWAVGNARVEPRGNAIVITKQTAGAAKIDPLMATFNAVALMSMNPAGAAPSIARQLETGTFVI